MSTSTFPTLSLAATSHHFFPSPPPQGKPLDQFSFFPYLPAELRIAIYKFALPSRILTIHYNASSNTFTSPTALPALLSTTHESRVTCQKHYCLYFGTSSSEPRIYFNPHLDTLYLPRCGQMGYDENFRNIRNLIQESEESSHNVQSKYQEGINRVRRLDQLRSVAIDHVDPNIKRPWEGYNKASFLRGFPHLDEIILLLSPEEENPTEIIIKSPSKALPPQKQIVKRFRDPCLPPESILQIWWCFRQSFASEEHVLEEVCSEMGKSYEGFSLPTVRVKGSITEESYS